MSEHAVCSMPTRAGGCTRSMASAGLVILTLLVMMARMPSTTALERWYVDCSATPRLPTTLDDVGYLELHRELHVHSEFVLNTTQTNHSMTFHLDWESEVRFYVAPHALDVDLLLNEVDEETGIRTLIQESRKFVGSADVVSGLLKGDGKMYELLVEFHVWDQAAVDKAAILGCPQITMEMAIVPRHRIVKRMRAFKCAEETVTPRINFDGLAAGHDLHYNMRGVPSDFVVHVPEEEEGGIHFVHRFVFSVPHLTGRNGLWRLRAFLGHQFLAGGSIGMLLRPARDDEDSERPNILACYSNSECHVATRSRLNELSLREAMTSGRYELWLFRVPEGRKQDLGACIPYSFEIHVESAPEEHSVVNCQAPRLPKSFNEPGWLDHAGYMHFRGRIFMDLTRGGESPIMDLKQESYIRVHAAEHDVDIDLELVDANGGSTIASSIKLEGEENILVEVPKGKYRLHIDFFDTVVSFVPFCPTFNFEIAVRPIDQDLLVCPNNTRMPDDPGDGPLRVPHLPILQEQLNSTHHTFEIGIEGPFVFPISTRAEPTTVFRQKFTLMVPSVVSVEVAGDFVFSDMRVYIQSVVKRTWTVRGENRGNANFIRTVLEPLGEYEIFIKTGGVQNPPPLLNNFPECVRYTFLMQVFPREKVSEADCLHVPRVPSSLNTLRYMPIPNKVHFQDDFLVPVAAGENPKSKESMYIVTTVPAVIRVAASQPSGEVIDIRIYDRKDILRYQTRPDAYRPEEAITYQLDKDDEYRVDLEYYHLNAAVVLDQSVCQTFNLEVEVAPLVEVEGGWGSGLPQACADGEENMPAEDLLNGLNSHIVARGHADMIDLTYHFSQGDTPREHSIPFSTEHAIAFRALTTYNFLWSDLSLRLRGPNNTVIYGRKAYNMHSLESVILLPGSYVLDIYEAETLPTPFRRCVAFTLSVHASVARPPVNLDTDITLCPDDELPRGFNDVAYIHPLSAYRVHWAHRVRPSFKSGWDRIPFTLSKISVFRVHVPWDQTVNVTLSLETDEGADKRGVLIGKDYHQLLVSLAEGSYVFRMDYIFKDGLAPDPDECISFPMELAIIPEEHLRAITTLTQDECDSADLPTQLVRDEPYRNYYTRSEMWQQDYHHTISFNLTTQSVFSVDLAYDFVSGAMQMALECDIDIGLENRYHTTVDANIGPNRSFLEEVLPSGAYTLRIWDFEFQVARGDFDYVKCSPFTFAYFLRDLPMKAVHAGEYWVGDLKTKEEPMTGDEYCERIQQLPTDLYTEDGGSEPFGGPQDEDDGSIWLFGEKFPVPEARERKNKDYILFMIRTPSLVRVWARPTNPQTDMDLVIFKDANSTMENIVGHAMGREDYETVLVELEPREKPYVLMIMYHSVKYEEDPCQYFYMGIAIRPITVVAEGLECPFVPEGDKDVDEEHLPPQSITLQDNFSYFNEDLYFRNTLSDKVKDGFFEFPITVIVPARIGVSFVLGFDFVANDFRLHLRDANKTTLALGEMMGEVNHREHVNFVNTLRYTLNPGTYSLVIVEDVAGKPDVRLRTYCHHFGMAVMTSTREEEEEDEEEEKETTHRVSGEEAPHILAVDPVSGVGFDPAESFVLAIVFSHPVDTERCDMDTILQQHWVTLVDSSNTIVSPVEGIWTSDQHLRLRFATGDLRPEMSYTLNIDKERFVDSKGRSFTAGLAALDSITYTMGGQCTCHGHGTCDRGTCACDEGYAGKQCTICAPGFHRAGRECVPNVPCSDDTCHGHGTCDDSDGYPMCSCGARYASEGDQFCNICHEGYGGYPNCTRIEDHSVEELPSLACRVPRLPTTLNTIGFLGVSGHMHIQDDYFADIWNQRHDLEFTLHTESVFRVHAIHHNADVDIFLYNVTESGAMGGLMISELSMKIEEVMFLVLPPGFYKLRFLFFSLEVNPPVCDTFNLEMAIAPTSEISTAASRADQLCATFDSLPTFRTLDVGDGDRPFVFDSGNTFTVNAPTLRTPSREKLPWFFHEIRFSVPEVAHKDPYIVARIGYRFLLGGLGLLLQSDTDKEHCGENGADGHCVIGFNRMNQNVLERPLLPGNYSLWLYEPIPQNKSLARCSPFDFDFKLGYRKHTEERFDCEAASLPDSFNVPGFLDNRNARGSMHISDEYFLDYSQQRHEISLKIERPSLFRSFVPGHTVDIDMTLLHVDENELVGSSTTYNQDTLFAELSPGTYKFRLHFHTPFSFFEGGSYCEHFYMEVAIYPKDDLPELNPCPGATRLPDIPQNFTTPFAFGGLHTDDYSRSFFWVPSEGQATKDAVVAEWDFATTHGSSMVSVELSSAFIMADLAVVLIDRDHANSRVFAKRSKNHNSLMASVGDGHFTVQIINPRPLASAFECTEFNFALYVGPAPPSPEECSEENTRTLPSTFDTLQYMAFDGRMHVQGNFWVPRLVSNFAQHTTLIPHKSETPSLFRIYVAPHAIDIDVEICRREKNGACTHIIDAVATLSEEILLTKLEPQTEYELKLSFFYYERASIECASFNMEIEIGPDTIVETTCKHGGDHWPSLDGTLAALKEGKEYTYNNVAAREHLYFQQREGESRFFAWDFEVPSAVRFYAETGYNFLLGGLVLSLRRNDGDELIRYGVGYESRQVLVADPLPPGQYTLKIYESVLENVHVMGCVRFRLSVKVQLVPSSNVARQFVFVPEIPATLDSISYLRFDKTTHFSQNFYVPAASQRRNDMTVRVDEPSLIRVYTEPHDVDIDILLFSGRGDDSSTVLADSRNIYDNEETILHRLDEGSYTLSFRYLPGNKGFFPTPFDTVSYRMELAVAPLNRARNLIAQLPQDAHCPDTPLPSPRPNRRGFWEFHRTPLTVPSTPASTENVLRILPLTVKRFSLIYAQVEYDFMLNELSLQVDGEEKTSRIHISHRGQKYLNVHEIREVVPPGTYNLTVFQPTLVPDFMPHCIVFGLHVRISDAYAPQEHICNATNVLPSSVDADGDSGPFGGPIDAKGEVTLRSPGLLIPLAPLDAPQPEGFVPKEIMSFSPKEKSLVRLFTQASGEGTEIEFSLFGSEDWQIFPLHVARNGEEERAELFMVEPQERPHVMVLSFPRVATRARCPSFNMLFSVMPVATLQTLYSCSGKKAQLPPRRITKALTRIEALVPKEEVERYSTARGFVYSIDIEVTSQTMLEAFIDFHPLVSFFFLELQATTDSIWSLRAHGDIAPLDASPSSPSSLRQLMTGHITRGNYTLNIVHPMPETLRYVLGDDVCLPFVFALNLTSNLALSPPDVTLELDPPRGNDLDPSIDLALDARFSAPLFDKQGQRVLQDSGLATNPLFDVIYLEDEEGVHVPLAELFGDEDGLHWVMTFSKENLRSGTTYELKMRPQYLFDGRGKEIKGTESHTYTMRRDTPRGTVCSNHGTQSNGVCVCNEGYDGSECERCGNGFRQVLSADGAMECEAIPSQQKPCHYWTCGCRNQKHTNRDDCDPLGSCTERSDGQSPQCRCHTGYAGAFCGECSESYIGWPNCRKKLSCPNACKNGYCDPTTGTCKCHFHYTGAMCDQCVDGWTGSDCMTEALMTEAVGDLLRVIVVVFTWLLLLGPVFLYCKRRRGGLGLFTVTHTTEATGEGLDVEDLYDNEGRLIPISQLGRGHTYRGPTSNANTAGSRGRKPPRGRPR